MTYNDGLSHGQISHDHANYSSLYIDMRYMHIMQSGKYP